MVEIALGGPAEQGVLRSSGGVYEGKKRQKGQKGKKGKTPKALKALKDLKAPVGPTAPVGPAKNQKLNTKQ